MVKEYVRKSRVAETSEACARYRAMQVQMRANNRRFNSMLADLKSRLKELELRVPD